jgi:hypothetical protein
MVWILFSRAFQYLSGNHKALEKPLFQPKISPFAAFFIQNPLVSDPRPKPLDKTVVPPKTHRVPQASIPRLSILTWETTNPVRA